MASDSLKRHVKGWPHLKRSLCSAFTWQAIGQWAKAALAPNTLVTSDGPGCFAAVSIRRFDLRDLAAKIIVDDRQRQPVTRAVVKRHAEARSQSKAILAEPGKKSAPCPQLLSTDTPVRLILAIALKFAA